jgi:hypothetical protein
MQAVLRLGLIVEGLRGPNSGLVTSIEVERFVNGVRVIFRPLGSAYSSKNEEKKVEKRAYQDNDKKRKEEEGLPLRRKKRKRKGWQRRRHYPTFRMQCKTRGRASLPSSPKGVLRS